MIPKHLHTTAYKYCSNTSVTECTWLYRNKPVTSFWDIMRKRFGKTEVYPKDNSDDQGSPINGQLSGLFFMTNNINGEPQSMSQFGPRWFQVPAEFLFSVAPNVYFTKFYSMRGRDRYITLVTTRPRLNADLFCRRWLLPIDLNDSKFSKYIETMSLLACWPIYCYCCCYYMIIQWIQYGTNCTYLSET